MAKQKWVVGAFALLIIFSSSVMAGDDGLEGGYDKARDGYYNEAAGIFEPMANKGSGEAQFNLGLMYHSGMGVARDEREAVKLYHKAADNGHVLAQEYLAVGYKEGWFGLEKNGGKARYWQKRLEGK